MDMPDPMDTMEDTGERRRGPLMPSLQLMLMLMPTLGMDITIWIWTPSILWIRIQGIRIWRLQGILLGIR